MHLMCSKTLFVLTNIVHSEYMSTITTTTTNPRRNNQEIKKNCAWSGEHWACDLHCKWSLSNVSFSPILSPSGYCVFAFLGPWTPPLAQEAPPALLPHCRLVLRQSPDLIGVWGSLFPGRPCRTCHSSDHLTRRKSHCRGSQVCQGRSSGHGQTWTKAWWGSTVCLGVCFSDSLH